MTVLKDKYLPDSYIPESCKPEPPLPPREVVYGIGIPDEKLSSDAIGMIHGPEKDLFKLLEIEPDDGRAIIVRYNADHTDQEIYHWEGSRKLERQLKNWKKARQLCPICRGEE